MELVLGTVQFGLAYGVAGPGHAVPEPEVRRILELAARRGVRTLDTASAYGDIEERLRSLSDGLNFDFVSKVSAIPTDLDAESAGAWALRAARTSSARLGPRLRALMFHRAEDLAGARGSRIWEAVSGWAEEHDVALGASCYDPETCRSLHTSLGITVAQLPGNALDQRIANCPAGSQASPFIYLRSAFLQGLLLMPLPLAVGRIPEAGEALERWHRWLSFRGYSPVRGALAVVKGLPCASACVVGVDSAAQLDEIADAWDEAQPLSAPELMSEDPKVIDPRLWSKTS